MWDVLWHSVRCLDNFSGVNAIDRLIVAEIALVPIFRSLPCGTFAFDGLILHPINGETLRQPGAAVIDHNRAAMRRIRAVACGVSSDPFAAQRWGDHDRS